METIIEQLSIEGLDYSISLSGIIISVVLGLTVYVVAGLTFNRSMLAGENLMVSVSLPPIALTITGSIASNFALSLGMIGALSIVRYRTPIKSPYDLTMLFMLVTIGVVTGVNYNNALLLVIVFATLSFCFSLVMNYIPKRSKANTAFQVTVFTDSNSTAFDKVAKMSDKIASMTFSQAGSDKRQASIVLEFDSFFEVLKLQEVLSDDDATIEIEQTFA